jgi:hypothetical protein
MKNLYILLATGFVTLVSTSWAQENENVDQTYEPIRTELQNWDPVRGKWLSAALPAVINQTEVPVRTFPENVTPNQMLSLVPQQTLDRISSMASANQNDPRNGAFYTQMNNMVSNVHCTPRSGRSYGDPHLVSYDGARFSFQTVGEFVLTRSNDGAMEVQTRQKAQQEDFSLNTAVAMNVHGDRVCLYASNYPDNDRSTPIRLNGNAIHLSSRPYFLPNGGVITRSGRSFVIDWPTGESVTARQGVSGGMPFYNVSVNVNPCTRNYSGVLGNGNGSQRDDFDGGTMRAPSTIFAGSGNDHWERQRLAFLAKDFAEQHRVTMATSLFDYAPGQSTFTFTDRSFPRVHRSISDLDPRQRNLARRNCEARGIGAADMEGCIYDNAYLNIEPVPAPPVRNKIKRDDLKPVRGGVVNGNPPPPVRTPTNKPVRGVSGSDTPQAVPRPTPKPTPKPTTKPVEVAPSPSPTPRPTTRPTPTPRPATPAPKPRPSRPKPTFTPKPKPKPRPRPSTPTPRPGTRGGR